MMGMSVNLINCHYSIHYSLFTIKIMDLKTQSAVPLGSADCVLFIVLRTVILQRIIALIQRDYRCHPEARVQVLLQS